MHASRALSHAAADVGVWGTQAAQVADEDAGMPRVWLPGEGWVVVEPVQEQQQDEAGYAADDEVSDRDMAAAGEAGQRGAQVMRSARGADVAWLAGSRVAPLMLVLGSKAAS